MKKVLISILAVAAMFAAVSCAQSVEDKAKDLCEKAINAKTLEEFMQVAEEITEWQKTLSEEDQKKAQEAAKPYRKQLREAERKFR